MTRLFRVNTVLTGFIGEPGFQSFYFLDIATAVASVRALWVEMGAVMPQPVQQQVQGFGDVIESTTGELVDAWTGAEPAPSHGQQTGSYSAPVGVLCRWSTDTILNGQRLAGRTYLVPAGRDVFNASGAVNPTNISGVQPALSAFIVEQGSSFVIWHRPKFGPRPAGGGARPILRVGGHGLVTGSGVSPKAVVLRSRRD